MMAKGTYAIIVLATPDLDGAFAGWSPVAPRSSRSRQSSRMGFATAPSAIPRATSSASASCAEPCGGRGTTCPDRGGRAAEYMTTMSQRTEPPTIRFDAILYTIDERTILRVPEKASGKLPSRGQVAVQGTINGHGFQTVLEPDGLFGHWMGIDGKLQQIASLSAGDTARLEIELLKDWPEPSVPQDLETALATAPQKIQDLWKAITPMARWEWVRWVNATHNPDTRKRRVEVSISKMKSGKRRPCCFNLAACTDPNLSKNGRLMEPA